MVTFCTYKWQKNLVAGGVERGVVHVGDGPALAHAVLRVVHHAVEVAAHLPSDARGKCSCQLNT